MNPTQILSLISIVIIVNTAWNHIYRKPSDNINTYYNQDHTNTTKTNKDKETDKVIKYFITFIAAFPLLMGLWAINYWFNEFNTATDSVNWEQYPGKILSKDIHYQRPAGQSGTQTSGKTYSPEVEYEFYYKDKTIKWNVIDFHNRPSHGDTSKSQAVLDRLPNIGETVNV